MRFIKTVTDNIYFAIPFYVNKMKFPPVEASQAKVSLCSSYVSVNLKHSQIWCLRFQEQESI